MINVKLGTEDQMVKAVRNPLFVDAEACGYEKPDDLWEIHMKKKRINHRNLQTIGFQILQVVSDEKNLFPIKFVIFRAKSDFSIIFTIIWKSLFLNRDFNW